MAATDYSSDGWTQIREDKDATLPDDRSSTVDGVNEITNSQTARYYFDPVNNVWLTLHHKAIGVDYKTVISYSDSADLYGGATAWTQCATTLDNSNTADPVESGQLSYDSVNDRWTLLRIVDDNSVSETEYQVVDFTFNGTDITELASDYTTDGNVQLQSMSLLTFPNTAASSGFGEDADTWRLAAYTPSGSTQRFNTSYYDDSAAVDAANGIESGSLAGNASILVPKHGGTPTTWYTTADLYNGTDAEIFNIKKASTNDSRVEVLNYDSVNDRWAQASTALIVDGSVDYTNGTAVESVAAWYDSTAGKWFCLSISNYATSFESILSSSADGVTWADTPATPDSAISTAWGNVPSTYVLGCWGGAGKAYVLYRDNTQDSFNPNYNAYVISYDSAADEWTAVARMDPTPNGASSEWVYDGGFTVDGATVYVSVRHETDGYLYHYAQNFNEAPVATFTSPEDGEAIESRNQLTLNWNFSDADGDTQAYYRIRRVIDATTTEYWNGSGWDSSEGAGNKIAGTAKSVNLGTNWGDAGTQTSHAYSIQVWDSAGTDAGYTDTITIYPTSSVSTVKGYTLPRPIKRQQDLNATLRSNQDYSVSWINNYLPSYGDLNNDLYTKGGLRPAATSRMRTMIPPVVGSFSVGTASNYFQDVAATNIYRTNELALSSARAKKFRQLHDKQLLKMVLEVPVEEFTYKDERMNGDTQYRYGLVAEDIIYWMNRNRMDQNDYSFISLHENAEGETLPYLHADQLVPVLWKAVQELYELLQDVLPPGRAMRLKRIDDNVRRRDRD